MYNVARVCTIARDVVRSPIYGQTERAAVRSNRRFVHEFVTAVNRTKKTKQTNAGRPRNGRVERHVNVPDGQTAVSDTRRYLFSPDNAAPS